MIDPAHVEGRGAPLQSKDHISLHKEEAASWMVTPVIKCYFLRHDPVYQGNSGMHNILSAYRKASHTRATAATACRKPLMNRSRVEAI
jgi:hypothetical protein